ncbi:hypothetical protein BDB00DRAFT_866640 [Zychaea mexicana]|uniref:uncharacterized protein n=1 Tax=Zychaea mexicana TaxID=64656 RepID=UPI0022FEDD26|nr:uncharacterized protein BDB00DRAFT_866640 [Zychaea mexicana]KAI9499154.1 hypothetical protein BDB00DRAFT_866640 [Zychaea mexicana]
MPKTEIRRLLKQQRSERQKEKRVEHPLAKYDTEDQLTCVVCNSHVKSTWPAHLGSAFHKENMARLRALKQQKQNSQQQQQRPVKRTSSPVQEQEPSIKRAKHEALVRDEQVNDEDEDEEMNDNDDAGHLPADFFDNAPAAHSKPASGPGEEGEEEEEEEEEAPALPPQQQRPAAPQQQQQPHYQPASNLPQGFFDNAEEEARVRRAPPPIEQFENKLDEEYTLFKEAMADTIVEAEKADEEDEEELWLDRDQEMFRQQAEFDSRVDKLKDLRAKTARGEFAAPSEEEKMSTVRVDYDDTERELRTGLKSDARNVLKKAPPQKVATVFDDMDMSSEEDEDEEDEDDWRAQQL